MKYTTNLFPKKEQTTIDKIAYFALHYLRYILVITQFVTICVFFYRFKADQEIVDLKDTLSQKKAIVDSTQTLLERVKELDFKIGTIKGLYSQQDSLLSMYNYAFQNLPQDVAITSMVFEQDKLYFDGKTSNIQAVQSMYEKFKTDKVFSTVSLEGINKTEDGYTFKIELSNLPKTDASQ